MSGKKFMLYKFYYGQNCVYLGRTAQPIQDRMRGHFFAKPMHRLINIMCVSKIEIAQCNSEADMFLYEIYYINLLKPMLNRDDKAFDNLTVSIPELQFEEYTPKLMDKWKSQVTEEEIKKERKQKAKEEWYEKRDNARKQLKGDDWWKWLEANPQP